MKFLSTSHSTKYRSRCSIMFCCFFKLSQCLGECPVQGIYKDFRRIHSFVFPSGTRSFSFEATSVSLSVSLNQTSFLLSILSFLVFYTARPKGRTDKFSYTVRQSLCFEYCGSTLQPESRRFSQVTGRSLIWSCSEKFTEWLSLIPVMPNYNEVFYGNTSFLQNLGSETQKLPLAVLGGYMRFHKCSLELHARASECNFGEEPTLQLNMVPYPPRP